VQLGFVIDHSRCIGCHACTVACKSENGVPLGKFRTWVKYTEEGTFPSVRRSFAVLRCNQCTAAPCVTICPVGALEKRADGIVDVDPKACIGCKACMQGCPYDALYLNEGTGTAEKCHFCAHRAERGLAPACAVVCPTEAIIPGDFDDPNSAVSRMRARDGLVARKVEAGTGPNVFYREVAAAGIDPLRTNASGGYLWAQALSGPQMDAQMFEAVEAKARARTVYDVAHPPLWGGKITGYLFAKSLSAGAVLAGLPLVAPLRAPEVEAERAAVAIPLAGLIFLAVTCAILVADLKRPERFFYILTRPNLRSWLARGTFVLVAYGGVSSFWFGFGTTELVFPAAALAAAAAAYTGWLFGQAKGRVLWMRRGMALHLLVQAFLAGSALLLLLDAALDLAGKASGTLRWGLVLSLSLHLGMILAEGRLAPRRRREEYARALRLLTHGPYARRRRLALLLGIALPLLLAALPIGEFRWPIAGAVALAGLFLEEDLTVRAGQALAIS
jgi:Fe-S-cluster-containing dehydrogenase component